MNIKKKNLKESKLQILKKYYKGSLDNKKEEIKEDALKLVKRIEEKV